MRWLRIGLFTLAGILALLLTAVALILTVDFGRFKPDIEKYVTDLLERELRIDGEFHATVGSTIDIYAEDVFFANPDWANEAAFATAETIDISVNTWSLFNWPIQVERANVLGIDSNIEFSGDGRASWTFEKFRNKPKPADGQTKIRRDLPVLWDNVLINEIDVSFSGGALKTPIKIYVTSGKGIISQAGYMETTVEGFLNETPLSLADKTGPVENFLAMRDVRSQLTGNIGRINIVGDSHIQDVYQPTKPTIALKIDGPSAEYLTDILNLPHVTEGPFRFEAQLKPADGVLDISVVGVFGEFALDVGGFVASLQELNTGELNVSANGPDITKVLTVFGIQTAEPDPFDLKGTIKRDGANLSIDDVMINVGESRVSIDGAFPKLPTVEDSHLALIATGPDYGRFNRLFGAPGRLGGSFLTTLDLSPTDDGRTLIELSATAPDVSVNVVSRLSAEERFRNSNANIQIDGKDISKILAIYGFENIATEAFNLKADISVDDSGYLLESARAIVGDDVLTVTGRIGARPIAGETDLEFDLSGTDLSASIVALGGEGDALPKGGYHLRGQVRKEADLLYLRNIRAAIGDNGEYELTLDGFLTPQQGLVGSEFTLKTHGASLSALADQIGIPGIPDFPFVVSADIRRGAATTYINNGDFEVGVVEVGFNGHIGDNPLQDDLDFAIEASAPRLPDVVAEFGVSPSIVPPGDLQFSAAVHRDDGVLTIDRLSGNLSDVSMKVSGTVGDLPDLSGTLLQIDVRGPDLAAALPEQFRADILKHSFAITSGVRLHATSVELDALSASLGQTNVRGGAIVGLDPVMDHGEYSLTATSPDLFELFPESKLKSDAKVANMRFDGAGRWEDKHYAFDTFELWLGEGFLKIRGGIDGPPSFDRTDLHVDWHATSINNLSPLVGRELPDQPMRLRAHFQGSRKEMKAEEIILTVGSSDLVGNFALYAGEPYTVVLDVDSKLIDLAELLVDSDDAATVPAEPKKKKDRLIPDTPLPMEALKSLNATVNVEIARMTRGVEAISDIKLVGQIQDGTLRVDQFRLTGRRGGTLSGEFILRPDEEKGAALNYKLSGSELLMGLAADTENDLANLPLFELRNVASAKGATIREMAGSLNSYFRMLSGTGKIKAGSFEFLTQDFMYQVISALNPFAKSDPFTNVVCIAVLFHSIDGSVKNRPALVVQTDKLRIKGDTTVNLKNEKIDITFSTVPQKGLGISLSNLVNPYIKVVGTMADPTLSLDPEGVLIEGSVAVATMGLSIIAKGLKDRFLSEKDACGKAVTEADQRYEDYLLAKKAAAAEQGQ